MKYLYIDEDNNIFTGGEPTVADIYASYNGYLQILRCNDGKFEEYNPETESFEELVSGTLTTIDGITFHTIKEPE